VPNLLFVRRNGARNKCRRRAINLPDLPPLTALYCKRQALFVDRKPTRDYGNVAGVERTPARSLLRRAAGVAWRAIFYAVVAIWMGLAFGTALDMALRATR
jgi:hypothetical protein